MAKYAVSKVQQFSNSQALSEALHAVQSAYGPKSGDGAGPEPDVDVISQHDAPSVNENKVLPGV
jgi:hypothetical protein